LEKKALEKRASEMTAEAARILWEREEQQRAKVGFGFSKKPQSFDHVVTRIIIDSLKSNKSGKKKRRNWHWQNGEKRTKQKRKEGKYHSIKLSYRLLKDFKEVSSKDKYRSKD